MINQPTIDRHPDGKPSFDRTGKSKRTVGRTRVEAKNGLLNWFTKKRNGRHADQGIPHPGDVSLLFPDTCFPP